MKHELLDDFQPKAAEIMVNSEVVDLIKSEADNFEQVILVSASPQAFVERMVAPLGIFDAIYGSRDVNLKSHKKLDFIRQKGFDSFVYVGDSGADEVLFQQSTFYYKIIDGKPIKQG